MRVKSLALGLIAAAGLFALSGSTASAQHVHRPYYGGGAYPAPPVVYRPVYVAPAPVAYPAYGYASPGLSFGYSSGYRPYYSGGYYGGPRYYGGGSGFSFGFNIR